MTVNAQMLFDEKDYTGTYPYVADGVIKFTHPQTGTTPPTRHPPRA